MNKPSLIPQSHEQREAESRDFASFCDVKNWTEARKPGVYHIDIGHLTVVAVYRRVTNPKLLSIEPFTYSIRRNFKTIYDPKQGFPTISTLYEHAWQALRFLNGMQQGELDFPHPTDPRLKHPKVELLSLAPLGQLPPYLLGNVSLIFPPSKRAKARNQIKAEAAKLGHAMRDFARLGTTDSSRAVCRSCDLSITEQPIKTLILVTNVGFVEEDKLRTFFGNALDSKCRKARAEAKK